MNVKPFRVLFLCTGNSCRSQMAEGFANSEPRKMLIGFSAGTHAKSLDPLAIQVMKESGRDISHQRSKNIDELIGEHFDCVVTVCSNADESCPVFPAQTLRIHRPFDDPPRLAKEQKDEAEVLRIYRRVRDEIQIFVEDLPRIILDKKMEQRGS